jgi:hypothetical protein
VLHPIKGSVKFSGIVQRRIFSNPWYQWTWQIFGRIILDPQVAIKIPEASNLNLRGQPILIAWYIMVRCREIHGSCSTTRLQKSHGPPRNETTEMSKESPIAFWIKQLQQSVGRACYDNPVSFEAACSIVLLVEVVATTSRGVTVAS